MTAAANANPAPAAAGPRLAELFPTVGAAIHRRLREVAGGDEARARADAEALFVRFYLRFVVRRAADLRDDAARWGWIYRVATSHALRSLGPGARPGAGRTGADAPSSPAPAVLPTMEALRAFDEATQTMVVLARLDRLPEHEIADVLELSPELVRRKLADARGTGVEAEAAVPTSVAAHPSRFVLDRDRSRADSATAAHLAACEACRATVNEGERAASAFAGSVTAGELERVAGTVRAETARLASGPRWKRIFWLSSAFVLVTVMAFVVARPRALKPNEIPFRGTGTASREKAAGLQITSRRGTDVGALVPGMFSRFGDRLHFRVRAEGPRYLEVRVRGPKDKVRLFPAAGVMAARVLPGQELDRDYVIDAPVASPGHWLVIEGLFSEREFALDQPPGRDVQVVPVRIDIEP